MERYRNSEILPGVKAIYRSGDMIYQDPSSLTGESSERPAGYGDTHQQAPEHDDKKRKGE
ncbi:MAG TPA: hypothetical protein ENO00_10400 [Deltaproteobacteria bacterium]|nr:hypothetical protein [Deltaproteobacteria bacterium]